MQSYSSPLPSTLHALAIQLAFLLNRYSRNQSIFDLPNRPGRLHGRKNSRKRLRRFQTPDRQIKTLVFPLRVIALQLRIEVYVSVHSLP